MLTAALLAGLSDPAAAVAQSGPPAGLIRCPDWQRYAPQVRLARASDGQTAEVFTLRAAQGAPVAKPSGTASGSRPPSTRALTATPPKGASAPASDSPTPTCSHIVAKGDTLSKISKRYLGTAARWREIQSANRGLDPNRLRIGQRITLPCARPAVTPPSGAPAAGTGFLARLFGGGGAATTGSDRAKETSAAGPAKPAKTAVPSKPAPAVVVPSTPPLPVWTAKRGEYLADVLRRWGKVAGYTVIIDSTDAWRLGVPIRLKAGFEDAVDELVSGLAHDGTPPRVRLYPNAVLRLGGPL